MAGVAWERRFSSMALTVSCTIKRAKLHTTHPTKESEPDLGFVGIDLSTDPLQMRSSASSGRAISHVGHGNLASSHRLASAALLGASHDRHGRPIRMAETVHRHAPGIRDRGSLRS